MNATTDLTISLPSDPATVFVSGGVETVLEQLEKAARATKIDISTPVGRKACASLAYKIARSKTALDEAGKALNEDKRRQINAVDSERRMVRERLDALAAEGRAPLTRYEQAEAARVDGHESALAEIVEPPDYGLIETADELAMRLSHLQKYPPRDWQEFASRAEETLAAEVNRTENLLARALKREAEQAELIRLRREAEEISRLEAARAQAERDRRVAAEAAEMARRQAEAQAQRLRAEEAARRAREQQEAEEERQAIEARAEAAAQAARQAEADRIAAAQQAERDRVVAAEKAERDRVAAAERAVAEERRRIDEQRRRESVEKAEQQRLDAKRAADKAHRGRINTAIVDALVRLGIAEDQAKAVVILIARNNVPHVSIGY